MEFTKKLSPEQITKLSPQDQVTYNLWLKDYNDKKKQEKKNKDEQKKKENEKLMSLSDAEKISEIDTYLKDINEILEMSKTNLDIVKIKGVHTWVTGRSSDPEGSDKTIWKNKSISLRKLVESYIEYKIPGMIDKYKEEKIFLKQYEDRFGVYGPLRSKEIEAKL